MSWELIASFLKHGENFVISVFNLVAKKQEKNRKKLDLWTIRVPNIQKKKFVIMSKTRV